jgi:hypothetical protein
MMSSRIALLKDFISRAKEYAREDSHKEDSYSHVISNSYSPTKKLLNFIGPGYLVAVLYFSN